MRHSKSTEVPRIAYVVHDWKLAKQLNSTLDRRKAIVISVPACYVGYALDTIIFIDYPPHSWAEDPELSAKYKVFCDHLKTMLRPQGKILHAFDAPPLFE